MVEAHFDLLGLQSDARQVRQSPEWKSYEQLAGKPDLNVASIGWRWASFPFQTSISSMFPHALSAVRLRKINKHFQYLPMTKLENNPSFNYDTFSLHPRPVPHPDPYPDPHSNPHDPHSHRNRRIISEIQ